MKIYCKSRRETEASKKHIIDWLRRMSDRHWKMSSDADSESEKYYHRGKAHAYGIVMNVLQDQSLISEYEQASAELEGTEK